MGLDRINIDNQGASTPMNRTVSILIVAAALALSLPRTALAQPAPRPLSFAEVATAAAQNNLQLRAAAFDVAVAQAQFAQARGGRLPQVALSGTYTRSQEQAGQTLSIPNPFGPTPPVITVMLPAPDPTVIVLRVGLQYPLYTGGRAESQIALAEANLHGAKAVFERAAQQIVFAAQQAYLQALLATENVIAAQGALEQADESLRVARARLQAGVAPDFDVLQAEVAVANAEQTMVRTRTSVRNAHAGLDALLNLPLDTPLAPTDTLEPRPVSGTLQTAIARALSARPELAEVQARAAAARASIELAASGGRPNVAIGADYAVSGSASSLNGNWSATLAVTLSLFDGGITRERIREAELRLRQLTTLEAERRQRIELEVRQAWLALEQASAELTAASRGVQQAREAARIAGVRYQAGVGTSLEILSAQSTLAQAEFGLASARFNQNLARIQLFLAAGGSL